jgi:DNA polymerase-3 subunit delta'
MAGKTLMTLFPLINQEKNHEQLHNILKNNRVANAYLFYGPEGSGSEGFALEFAAMLNCQSTEKVPCGNCSGCRKMRRLEHSNLELVYPIPARQDQSDSDPFKKFTAAEMTEIQELIHVKSQNPYLKISVPKAKHIPINFIREIKRRTYLRSQESGWKVVVIFDAHLLTESAANAFLKILEEPPEKSTFILSTANLNAILPTIVSRCQAIHFPPLPTAKLKAHLLSQNITENRVNLIIRLSGGDVGKALNLVESDLDKLIELTLDILRMTAVWDIENIFKYVETLTLIYREDSARFQQILLAITFWFRDAAVLKEGIDPADVIHSELTAEIQKFVAAFPDFDPHSAISSVENCIDFINRNVYINLVLLNMFFQLNHAINPGK